MGHVGLRCISVFCARHCSPRAPLRRALRTLISVIQRNGTLCVNVSGCPGRGTRFTCQCLRRQSIRYLLCRKQCGLFGHRPRRRNVLRRTGRGNANFVTFSPLTRNLLAGQCLGKVPRSSEVTHKNFLGGRRLARRMFGGVGTLGRITNGQKRALTRVTLT